MTRDELVQAAIEALDAAHVTNGVHYEVLDPEVISEVASVVVDTVLANLGAVHPVPDFSEPRVCRPRRVLGG